MNNSKKQSRAVGLVFVLVLILFVVFIGCTGNENSSVSGVVNKGPFILGSTVNASPVDGSGNPTGDLYVTQTANDLGEFDLDIEHDGLVSLQANGFYFNEITGELSGAQLTLRAFANLSGASISLANINLITHLTYLRIQALFSGGLSFDASVAQAESELVAALGIGLPGLALDGSGIEMSVTGGDTGPNAYLFAVSAVLLQVARVRSPESEDASFQEVMNEISSQLADTGDISASLKEEIRDAQLVRGDPDSYLPPLIPSVVMEALAGRLASVGSSQEVPNIDTVLDQDFDALVNAEDNCWYIANKDQADRNGDGLGDACDPIYVDEAAGLIWEDEELIVHQHTLTDISFPGDTLEKLLDYCEDLELSGYKDWRVPNIDEVRSLIRDCENTEPGGACPVTDGSDSSDNTDDCSGCEILQGPGETGCYMDPAMKFEWAGPIFSSSKAYDDPEFEEQDRYWIVYFEDGRIVDRHYIEFYARCVHDLGQ
ncbi:MAG: DUF1566 domain-containing protein [Myxococcota bacterium]|nr:DUF1566 domain-containing protein [Myxococcota bacterium]